MALGDQNYWQPGFYSVTTIHANPLVNAPGVNVPGSWPEAKPLHAERDAERKRCELVAAHVAAEMPDDDASHEAKQYALRIVRRIIDRINSGENP